MSSSEVLDINNIVEVLRTAPTDVESYGRVLDSLNPIVIQTAQDENYRNELAGQVDLWNKLNESLEVSEVSDIIKVGDDDLIFWYLRTLRGVMLLIRNISVSNQETPQQLLIQNKILRIFLELSQHKISNIDMETSLYTTALTVLHNISKVSVVFDKTTIDQLMSFLAYPIQHPDTKMEVIFPYLLFFENMLHSDDFLYYFFRHNLKDSILYDFLMVNIMQTHSHLFDYFVINDKKPSTEGDDINENREMSNIDLIFVRCFRKIVTNESFSPYLLSLEETHYEKFTNFLRIGQVVATSIETWDKYELTGIMTWCFDVFSKTAVNINDYFEKDPDDITIAKKLHQNISSTLDIMSSFSRYEHVQKYILSYKGLEKLIDLLGIFQKHLIRINFVKDKTGIIENFKTTDSLGNKITDNTKINSRVDYQKFTIMATNFPESKLLIIEILGNLCYKKKEIQDEIRLKHGLELVLSNCVIDDNDPFIKERSIVCIKFLLENNAENQKFVASLEAKKAADDDTLSQAGYEVDIDKNGEIQLLPKKTEDA